MVIHSANSNSADKLQQGNHNHGTLVQEAVLDEAFEALSPLSTMEVNESRNAWCEVEERRNLER